jgi:sucrose-6F-phosphate phosphohydrolase
MHPTTPERRFRLFSADLDGTLLGNPEATLRFNRRWSAAQPRPWLCYNSGRTVADILERVQSGLLAHPDFIIGSVGTEIHDVRVGRPLEHYRSQFAAGWDLPTVERLLAATPGIERQPPAFLHPYKSSWYLRHASPEQVESLRGSLAEAGLRVNLVYSGGLYLDVLPAVADKGRALAWLAAELGVPLEEILVAGDSGNDISMFLLPGVSGIVVENALPELLEATVHLPTVVATRVVADGVLEGLEAFGVLPPAASAAAPGAGGFRLLDPDLRKIASSSALGGLRREDRQVIAEGYQQALAAVRRNVTPLGFSACSLEDNDTVGTDVNYRSVWARDGAMTAIWTLRLGLPDLTECARRTLDTLLAVITRIGQLPANVRIDDGRPDYSGVGGICSVDSGLWVIIAAHHYVKLTGDQEFLRRHESALRAAMRWLSSLDANADDLLEIPEAGDWTDLFGRSYNVLYDEVLWFRANVCFGHLLEALGDAEGAAEHHRVAQRVRARVLEAFWPTTRRGPGSGTYTFADQQHQLGDTAYLLAQISPFGFSWRCDVLGNILAFLTNLVDAGQASTTFKFMWGSGVNEPGPVANLYPPVQAGDPDWRDYYTVNLLNLPHHYHNGGIWPFIGGMWVRYIHRLGLGDLAARELARLAHLNRTGRVSDWEFNEWMHGRTGRPMGKRFQAWSAASYLRACVDLRLVDAPATDD